MYVFFGNCNPETLIQFLVVSFEVAYCKFCLKTPIFPIMNHEKVYFLEICFDFFCSVQKKGGRGVVFCFRLIYMFNVCQRCMFVYFSHNGNSFIKNAGRFLSFSFFFVTLLWLPCNLYIFLCYFLCRLAKKNIFKAIVCFSMTF